MHMPPWAERSARRVAGRSIAVAVFAACAGLGQAQEVGGGSKGAVTGAAGGATAAGARGTLARCDQALGTIGVVEDTNAGSHLSCST